MQWQPIESAPTNTSLLMFIPNAEHYGPGIYRGMLVDMGTGRRWMTSGLHMGRDCGTTYEPTHWMPLPEPPNEANPCSPEAHSPHTASPVARFDTKRVSE